MVKHRREYATPCAILLCFLLLIAPLQALNVTDTNHIRSSLGYREPVYEPWGIPAAAIQRSAAGQDSAAGRQLENPAPAQDTLPLYLPVTLISLNELQKPAPAQRQAPAVIRLPQRTVPKITVPRIERRPAPVINRTFRTSRATASPKTLAQNPVRGQAGTSLDAPIAILPLTGPDGKTVLNITGLLRAAS